MFSEKRTFKIRSDGLDLMALDLWRPHLIPKFWSHAGVVLIKALHSQLVTIGKRNPTTSSSEGTGGASDLMSDPCAPAPSGSKFRRSEGDKGH